MDPLPPRKDKPESKADGDNDSRNEERKSSEVRPSQAQSMAEIEAIL